MDEVNPNNVGPELGKKTEASLLIQKSEDDDDDKGVCSRCCTFPLSVYFILGTEFCERYSYYGMRAILIIYLTQHLMMDQSNATALYHFFICLCYFSPIIGAIIADNNFGKFRTILGFSIIFAIGNCIMSLTALGPPGMIGPIFGLIFIGFGTGGIKPCVNALGGDQIPPGKTKTLESFYSVFYFAINLGSMLSTVFTPLLRADVQCLGDDCYPLAFGIPAILMVVALGVFVCGYKLYVTYPPEKNVFGNSICCVCHAIKNYFKYRKSDPKPGGVMGYATDEYSENFIEDVRQAGRVLFVFLPCCIFFSLYDQQGSRWTLQAAKMDGVVFNKWVIHPDQMTVANTAIILIMIPLFDSVIYPLMNKMQIPNKPLQRMVAGQIFIALAFLSTFILQLHIEATQPPVVPQGMTQVRLVSLDPCPLKLSFPTEGMDLNLNASTGYSTSSGVSIIPTGPVDIKVQFASCESKPRTSPLIHTQSINIPPGERHSLVVWETAEGKLAFYSLNETIGVNKEGKGYIRLVGLNQDHRTSVSLESDNTGDKPIIFKLNDGKSQSVGTDDLTITKYNLVPQGLFWFQLNKPSKTNYSVISMGRSRITAGGTFTLMILQGPAKAAATSVVTTDWIMVRSKEVEGATLSIFLQLPQYFLVTIAEVLFSITGLHFAYTEAPSSMKSLMSSAWLLSISIGNVIVMIVAEVPLFSLQSWEFLLFFFLSIISTVIFIIIAYLYKPRVQTHGTEMLMSGKPSVYDEAKLE